MSVVYQNYWKRRNRLFNTYNFLRIIMLTNTIYTDMFIVPVVIKNVISVNMTN
jgi:hypothetical protein